MKKFCKFKTFTMLIVLGVLFAFGGMAFATEKSDVMAKKTTDIVITENVGGTAGSVLASISMDKKAAPAEPKKKEAGASVVAASTQAIPEAWAADKIESDYIVMAQGTGTNTGMKIGGAAIAATFVPGVVQVVV